LGDLVEFISLATFFMAVGSRSVLVSLFLVLKHMKLTCLYWSLSFHSFCFFRWSRRCGYLGEWKSKKY